MQERWKKHRKPFFASADLLSIFFLSPREIAWNALDHEAGDGPTRCLPCYVICIGLEIKAPLWLQSGGKDTALQCKAVRSSGKEEWAVKLESSVLPCVPRREVIQHSWKLGKGSSQLFGQPAGVREVMAGSRECSAWMQQGTGSCCCRNTAVLLQASMTANSR